MRTVGRILKDTREEKFYSLEEIEKNTKIRKELLEALEADNYDKLPPSTFVQGFIKNYGKFLNLDGNKLLAIYRRDFEAKKHPPLVLDSFKNPLDKKQFKVTPTQVIGGVLVLIILGFFTYLWVEYRQFVGPPMLEVTSPLSQQTVELPSVLVSGKTDPEAKVTINNQQITVDKSGDFKQTIKLSASINTVTIVATGKFGQSVKVERDVIVKQ